MLNQLHEMLKLVDAKDVDSEIIATAKGKYQYSFKNLLKLWLSKK